LPVQIVTGLAKMWLLISSASKGIVAIAPPAAGRVRCRPNKLPEPQSQANQSAAQSVLIESSVELKSFSSSPVDDNQFSVPAGYAEITSDMNRSR